MMKITPLHLLLAAVLPLAACAGRGRSTVDNEGAFKHLADKLSDGHDKLAIRKIAVLPFSYVDRHPSADGAVISEKLITRIANEGDLEIVERSLLAKVLEELSLQHSGIVDESSIKGLGKILGVEAVVAGTLTKQRNGSLEINARLIKTETAAILAVATGNVYPDWETTRETAPNFAVVLPQQDPRPEPHQEPSVDAPVDNSQVTVMSGAARWWPADGSAVEKITGAPGVLVNGAAFGSGVIREAFDFDGKDDYISVGRGFFYNTLLDGRHAFSVSMWIKRGEKDAQQGIFAKGSDPLFTGIYINNSNFGFAPTFMIKSSTGGRLDVATSRIGPSTGKWEHWAFTYDGKRRAAGVKIYRDGASLPLTVYGDDFGNGVMSNSASLEFGRLSQPLTWHFSGSLDDIRLFSKELSDKEISSLARRLHARAGTI